MPFHVMCFVAVKVQWSSAFEVLFAECMISLISNKNLDLLLMIFNESFLMDAITNHDYEKLMFNYSELVSLRRNNFIDRLFGHKS